MDERLAHSLRCSWSEGRGERGKDEVEQEEESHGVDKRHQISVTRGLPYLAECIVAS